MRVENNKRRIKYKVALWEQCFFEFWGLLEKTWLSQGIIFFKELFWGAYIQGEGLIFWGAFTLDNDLGDGDLFTWIKISRQIFNDYEIIFSQQSVICLVTSTIILPQ